MGYPMDPYYEVKLLRTENAKLLKRVKELEAETRDLTRKWAVAVERSSTQTVRALLAGVDPRKMA